MNENRDKAAELYDKLNRLFSSTHNDTAQDQNDAIEILYRALQSGVDETLFEKKMKDMLDRTEKGQDFYKSKLSNAIRNKFWEKSFGKSIQFRAFKP